MTVKRSIFNLFHSIYDKRFHPLYVKYSKNLEKSLEELKYEQNQQLKKMIHHCYKNVKYYRDLFNKIRLSPSDIKTVEDLNNLPLLNRKTIKKNYRDFIPDNIKDLKYHVSATGGTTGIPLEFRVDKEQRLRSGVLLYRGWGFGGYDLGDRMVLLAGSSLDNSYKSSFSAKINQFFRNYKKLSAYEMTEDELITYYKLISRYKPKFLRGYSSSINLFAKWLIRNNLKIDCIDSVFTTSEKLYDNMRQNISNAFKCDVFDGYGLADGGVSAYECKEHSGLHIDTECSILEIVDDNNNQITDGYGKILATSLYNYSMPFLRYDTTDSGHITNEKCKCGRPHLLLRNIYGKSDEHLISPEGKYIHGVAFFNTIFMKNDNINVIDEYQVIQSSKDELLIKIVCKDKSFPEDLANNIITMIKNNSSKWKVTFEYVDEIPKTKAGKHKFIINKLNESDESE